MHKGEVAYAILLCYYLSFGSSVILIFNYLQ